MENANPKNRLLVFLHSGDYDRVHQGAAIAAAGVAAGRPVEVYFFWWALERLAAGRLGRPAFAQAVDEPGESRAEALAQRFEQRGYPTAATLLESARRSGNCRVFACSASMELLGLKPTVLEPLVDSILGWSAILARTEGVADRFYL
jgi:peroxiredoxin family protein